MSDYLLCERCGLVLMTDYPGHAGAADCQGALDRLLMRVARRVESIAHEMSDVGKDIHAAQAAIRVLEGL